MPLSISDALVDCNCRLVMHLSSDALMHLSISDALVDYLLIMHLSISDALVD